MYELIFNAHVCNICLDEIFALKIQFANRLYSLLSRIYFIFSSHLRFKFDGKNQRTKNSQTCLGSFRFGNFQLHFTLQSISCFRTGGGSILTVPLIIYFQCQKLTKYVLTRGSVDGGRKQVNSPHTQKKKQLYKRPISRKIKIEFNTITKPISII